MKVCFYSLFTFSQKSENVRPHFSTSINYSQSSRENATPSSGTSPLASYKEVPPPHPLPRFSPAFAMPALQRDELVFRLVRMSVTNFPPLPCKVGLILAWLLHRSRQGRWGFLALQTGDGSVKHVAGHRIGRLLNKQKTPAMNLSTVDVKLHVGGDASV